MIVVLFGERLLPDRSAARRSRATSPTTPGRWSSSTGSTTPATTLLTPHVGRGRGRDPAAVERRSARRVFPGHGHRERRPRRARRAAQGRGPRPGETALAVGDTLLLAGNLERARASTSTTPTCSSSTQPDAGPAPGRAARAGREAGARRSSPAMVVLLATGAVPPAVAGLLAAGAIVLSRRAHDRGRPTAPSPGRRSSSSAG